MGPARRGFAPGEKVDNPGRGVPPPGVPLDTGPDASMRRSGFRES